MKKVQRWRYYCDFCTKAGMSGFHMKNHELACTKNPARICKMCVKINEGPQASMDAMLALLPDPALCMKHYPEEDLGYDLGKLPARDEIDDAVIRERVAAALPALRELTHHCPVCIMAAFRQRGIPLPLVDGFNFTEEMKEMFSAINEALAERESYYY